MPSLRGVNLIFNLISFTAAMHLGKYIHVLCCSSWPALNLFLVVAAKNSAFSSNNFVSTISFNVQLKNGG